MAVGPIKYRSDQPAPIIAKIYARRDARSDMSECLSLAKYNPRSAYAVQGRGEDTPRRGPIVALEETRPYFSRNFICRAVKIGELFDCIIPTTVVKCLFLIKERGAARKTVVEYVDV